MIIGIDQILVEDKDLYKKWGSKYLAGNMWGITTFILGLTATYVSIQKWRPVKSLGLFDFYRNNNLFHWFIKLRVDSVPISWWWNNQKPTISVWKILRIQMILYRKNETQIVIMSIDRDQWYKNVLMSWRIRRKNQAELFRFKMLHSVENLSHK